MEIEKSRSGFYTVTFENINDMSEKDIRNELSSVGQICAMIWKKQRVFIRFKFKEEAEKALMKYGQLLNLRMAFNSERRSQHPVEEEEDEDEEDLKDHKKKLSSLSKLKGSQSVQNMDNSNQEDKTYCLILSNLPKKYTLMDVKALIEETKPLWIDLNETQVFNIRFACVILDSLHKVTYLVHKLNGFVICGEQLRAVEGNKLLKWKYD